MSNLRSDEKIALAICKSLIKELIKDDHKYNIDSQSLISLAKIQHVFDNYPACVIDGSILLSVTSKNNIGEISYAELDVGCNGFGLDSGGTVYTPGVGFDSYTGFLYSSDYDDTDITFREEMQNWKSNFLSLLSEGYTKIEIHDDATIVPRKNDNFDLDDIEE